MTQEQNTLELSAKHLADKSLRGEALSREEARAVLDWPEADVLSLLGEVFRVRQAHFGKKVRMNFLVNIQSGLCPENCSYCTQSKDSKAPIEKYRIMSPEEVMAVADRAVEVKAARLCMVASMRGPSDKDLEKVAEAVRKVKEKYPHLEICASLGLLKDGQASTMKDAGVHAYNHNLNTSEGFYEKICSTHTHLDRVQTVERACHEGLSPCSGALFGMGETREDILEVAYRLREMNVESIPVNFLIPVKGTSLAGKEELTPLFCLKILCLFRLLSPASELRIAGGREVHLRALQPLALYAANSLFIGDYLTTKGQPSSADIEMIRDLGFEIVGEEAGAPSAAPLADRVALTSRRERLQR